MTGEKGARFVPSLRFEQFERWDSDKLGGTTDDQQQNGPLNLIQSIGKEEE